MRTPAPALVLLLSACSGLSHWEPPPRNPAAFPVGAGSTEPLRFAGLGLASMRRGTEIGRYLWGLDCAAPYGREFWTSGRRLHEGSTWEDRFAEIMNDAGFDVAGGTARFYEVKQQRRRARYGVAAELKDVRLELCRREDWITGTDLGISGYGTVKVDWAVFDADTQRLLHRVTTTGSATIDAGVPEGDILLIEEAFSTAVEGLAADGGFRAAVAKGADPAFANDTRAADPAPLPGRPVALSGDRPPRLVIEGAPVPEGSVDDARRRIADALVPVGTGHGVVIGVAAGGSVLLAPESATGGNPVVTVRPGSGVMLDGTVEGRAPALGLVLVRVPARLGALPVRTRMVAISAAVHAVVDGRGRTVAGIVGGLYPDPAGGGTVLLADLDGPAPDAGAALLDDAGNLVALARPGAPALPGDSALPAFVPAAEALAALGATLEPGR